MGFRPPRKFCEVGISVVDLSIYVTKYLIGFKLDLTIFDDFIGDVRVEVPFAAALTRDSNQQVALAKQVAGWNKDGRDSSGWNGLGSRRVLIMPLVKFDVLHPWRARRQLPIHHFIH